MLRVCVHYFIFAFFTMAFPLQAVAATAVQVRGGEHSNYSRLVFDFKNKITYKTEKTSEGYRIVFDGDYFVDTTKLSVALLGTIKEFREENKTPLTVLIKGQGEVTLSDFYLGTRIVFDVKPAKKTAPKSSKNAEKKTNSVPVKQIKPVVVRAPSQDGLTALKKTPATPAKIPEAGKLKQATEEKTEKPVEKISELQRKIQENIRLKSAYPNFIMVSSITPTAMAAFTLHDRLWFVNSSYKTLISPQVVGSDKALIGKPENQPHDTAHVFRLKSLPGVDYMAQGSSLAWRLLIGHDFAPEHKPQQLQRIDVNSLSESGGKIFVALPEVSDVVSLTDPDTGFPIHAVTVGGVHSYTQDAYKFTEFEILPSPLGMAVMSYVDDLVVERVQGGVLIYRANAQGLVLSAQSNFDSAASTPTKEKKTLEYRGSEEHRTKNIPQMNNVLLDFPGWSLGGAEHTAANKALILSALPDFTNEGQVEAFMNLARMYLASGMGPEANGFLSLVQQAVPDLRQNPEFKALRGVSSALTNRHEEAFRYLSDNQIKDKTDIKYWRSYTVAKLSDWQQAIELLPTDLSLIHYYPLEIATPLALTLAEVSLRAGDVKRTEELFGVLKDTHVQEKMRQPDLAAFKYLQGEKLRQEGDVENAIDIWTKLYNGDDDLYRVRGGLALTFLEKQEKDLPVDDAIDRLERLRYAWRGDDLEAQVNYRLGMLYFESGRYVKGLNIMREAASYSKGPHLGRRIAKEMSDSFADIYLGRKLYELSGPEVAALYEHFSELIPSGEQGELVGRRLADRLVQAHLYDRAIEILTFQLENRLSGQQAYDVAVRLAVIHQFKEDPASSLAMLKHANDIRQSMPDVLSSSAKDEELALLTARALASTDMTQDALEILSVDAATPQMNKLRAEIAWEKGFWDDAADALQHVLDDNKITPGVHLDDDMTNVILQRAVALNLGGDRIRLANIREKFGEDVAKTNRARAFEVVTRLHQSAGLADRETLLSVVSEVDMFGGFLGAYRQQIHDDVERDRQEVMGDE